MPVDSERLSEIVATVLASWTGGGAIVNVVMKRLKKVVESVVARKTSSYEARIAALERKVFGTQRASLAATDEDGSNG